MEYQNLFTRVQAVGPVQHGIDLPAGNSPRTGQPRLWYLLGLLGNAQVGPVYLGGLGIAWRSTWEVEREVAEGQLVALLEAFTAPPNGIYAVFPHAKHLPLRVRLWIDFLKHHYGDAAYWTASP